MVEKGDAMDMDPDEMRKLMDQMEAEKKEAEKKAKLQREAALAAQVPASKSRKREQVVEVTNDVKYNDTTFENERLTFEPPPQEPQTHVSQKQNESQGSMSLRAGSESHLPDLSHMNFDLQQQSVTKSGNMPVNTSKVQFIHR